MGIIAAVGDSVTHLKVGTPAAMMTFGSYAEFVTVKFSFKFWLNHWDDLLIVCIIC